MNVSLGRLGVPPVSFSCTSNGPPLSNKDLPLKDRVTEITTTGESERATSELVHVNDEYLPILHDDPHNSEVDPL